ncbi:hypothetical protein PVAP13_6NG250500 [Panicum virgatum]|uniref:Uncharacterized protein n=1 Tax=Panicum virgatum TaxID=38727 RepID=A0A8T0R220_PANVG|nr:hypothetical protein PVAP13_6NG250500 [Panicum virgatum]
MACKDFHACKWPLDLTNDDGAEAAARLRYKEFVKGRAARKERKARREGIVDLCCSGVGATAFLGLRVMLTFR